MLQTIARINELARKQRDEGLTQAEKDEQANKYNEEDNLYLCDCDGFLWLRIPDGRDHQGAPGV